MRRIGNHFLRLLGRQRQWLGADLLQLVQLLWLGSEHGVYKQAVAPRRGHPPSRSMRAGNQAQRLQVGHHVADGGRRKLQPGSLGERARAHRLTVSNVAVYQCLEQQLGAIIQHIATF